LRDAEIEQRDLKRILKNHLLRIKHALRGNETLADRDAQPLPHRTLLALRRLLESKRPDEDKHEALKRQFLVPPRAETTFQVLQSTLGKIGVLSLSATPADMLMWSHYSGQHTGYCLGFERCEASILADERHTKALRYVDTYPTFSLGDLTFDWEVQVTHEGVSEKATVNIEQPYIQEVIYSKSTNWKYEQEWRVLVEEGAISRPYPGPLKRVIFGLRCSSQSRRLITSAVEQSTCAGAKFAEIRSRNGSFDLEVHDLP
jgi:Protein of unknown function (DUF2971)